MGMGGSQQGLSAPGCLFYEVNELLNNLAKLVFLDVVFRGEYRELVVVLIELVDVGAKIGILGAERFNLGFCLAQFFGEFFNLLFEFEILGIGLLWLWLDLWDIFLGDIDLGDILFDVGFLLECSD